MGIIHVMQHDATNAVQRRFNDQQSWMYVYRMDLIDPIINSLPILTANDLVNADDSCPICLVPFSSILSDPESGITKLDACNHIFCRKDLTQWIRSWHGSCPTCRQVFLDIRPPSESDDESSDGGEYIPNEHDDDFDDFDDDAVIATDEFSDAAEFEVDEMEPVLRDEWDNENQDIDQDGLDWAASDSDFPSEGGDDDAWSEVCEHE